MSKTIRTKKMRDEIDAETGQKKKPHTIESLSKKYNFGDIMLDEISDIRKKLVDYKKNINSPIIVMWVKSSKEMIKNLSKTCEISDDDYDLLIKLIFN